MDVVYVGHRLGTSRLRSTRVSIVSKNFYLRPPRTNYNKKMINGIMKTPKFAITILD